MKKLNRKQLIKIGITALTALLVLYVVSRFGHVITGPRIKIDSVPKEAIHNPVITLSGTIKGGRLFWINSVQMPIEKNGEFSTQLVVPPGYTIITLEAQDELGSRRRKRIAIYYIPDPAVQTEAPKIEQSTDFTEETTITTNVNEE